MATYPPPTEPCPICGQPVLVGRASPIQLERTDELGAPVLNKKGEKTYVYVQLPLHVYPFSHFDPTGLVEAACDHGLASHPDGREPRRGRSFIRSKYLDDRGRCPVCRGEPAPDDLTKAAS